MENCSRNFKIQGVEPKIIIKIQYNTIHSLNKY